MRLADRHVVIEKGRTVWTGSSEALAAAPEVRDTTCMSDAGAVRAAPWLHGREHP